MVNGIFNKSFFIPFSQLFSRSDVSTSAVPY